MSLSLLSLLISSAQAVPLSSVPAGGLVISEIQHNPDATADYRGEYVEIYNAHTDAIDVNGLVVESSGESGFTINQSITVAAGDYLVLAARSSSSANGGNTEVDFQYAYSTFKLGSNDSITISDGTTTFDSVSYNTTNFPIDVGAALILDNDTLDGTSNDLGQNWCTSGNVYGTGDFGTPGAANDGCSTIADLSVGDLVITEIMWDPTSVADYRGEWFEVYNASGTSLNLNGLVINSAGNTGHTITDDVIVAPGNQALLNVRVTTSLNGGTVGDYTYNYAEVGFAKTDSVSLVAAGTTIDSVNYGFSSHGLQSGKSISLASSVLTASGNDTASNWCAASSTYGDGDFGTPGSMNDLCGNVDGDGDGLIASEDCDDTDANIGVFTYFQDLDSDTYGNDAVTTTGCSAPAGYVEVGGDCNDSRSDINPDATEICDDVDNDCDNDIDDADATVDTSTGTTFYADSDSDTYGDDLTSLQQCDIPDGFVSIPGDCNDSDAAINPGASDIIGNGIDENCDGVDNNGGDNDGDGFTVLQGDCNDNNAAINPNASETCDGVDNDCDGDIDDADSDTPTDAASWFTDSDGDGFAGSANPTLACTQPANTFATATDCDDSNAAIFPNASEIVADGIDQDCDNGDTCYADADNDGFRTDNTVSSADLDCLDSGEAGSAVPNTDCDDTTASTNPNASEVCDGVDNDCDGDIDGADSSVDTSTGNTYYLDSDNDLYGDAANSTMACSKPFGYVPNSDDCDDTDYNIKPLDIDGDGFSTCTNDCDETNEFAYPGAAETESAVDCMTDADDDGYGDTEAPNGGVAGTDCDDSNAARSPGQSEVCDGIDNDCDTFADDADPEGATDATTWYHDNDSDTFGDINDSLTTCTQPADYITDNTDCDDNAAAVNPGATEVCDGIDNDCDNDIDDADASVTGQSTFFVDADLDGFAGSTTVDACTQPANTFLTDDDCDDSSAAVNPGATEVCDGLDNDCDTDIDEGVGGNTFFADTDNDTFGDPANTIDSCTQPAGYVTDNTDCDDNSAAINPNATEVCLDGIDSDCDNTDSLGVCEGDIADSDFTINGVTATGGSTGDRLGQALSYAGNITGTATNDFVLGSRWASGENGAAYIYAGASSYSGSTTTSSASITVTGQNSERFGFDVAGGTNLMGGITADFNGDGNDDLLVGAPNADVSGSSIGSAYMFYGPLSADTTSSAADVVFTGQFGQDPITPSNHNAVNTGYSVAFVGDVNNDGIADIAIGDPSKKNRGSTNGEAYLIFGRSDTFDGSGTQLTAQYEGEVSLNLASWKEQFGREILSDGDDREQMGAAIDAIGDVNGDGIDDLMIGAYRWDSTSSNNNDNSGAVFIWYGGTSLTNLTELTVSHNGANNTADITFVGANSGDQVGRSASGAGDFDGDGVNDIVIGSEHAGNAAGAVYVVKGTSSGTITLNPSNGAVLTAFTGESAGDGTGRWVSTLGNVDGDAEGTSDILVGSKYASVNGAESGAMYVILGGSGVTGTNSFSSAEVLLTGAAAGNRTGGNVSGMDDMDGDGISEILVGSELTNGERGAVQLIFGNTFQ